MTVAIQAPLSDPAHAGDTGQREPPAARHTRTPGEALVARAKAYQDQGRHADAIPLLEQALVLREKELGPGHLQVAALLDTLGQIHDLLGNYSMAESCLQRALAIRESSPGATPADLASTLNNLAMVHDRRGEHARAMTLFERSLAIFESTLGQDHPQLAEVLNNLGSLHGVLGEYERATVYLERARAIQMAAPGDAVLPALATTLSNLAWVHDDRGEYTRAMQLYGRARSILESTLGQDHPQLAEILNNQASLYHDFGNYDEAIRLYQRCLAIVEDALGPEHPHVAMALGNLAAVYDAQGAYERALPLYERSLANLEGTLGSNHPDVATALNNLAGLYSTRGEHARAEMLYQRALAIWGDTLGQDHPYAAFTQHNLALLHQDSGDIERALRHLTQSQEARERHLGAMLASGSEDQQRARIAVLAQETDAVLSFHLRHAPDHPRAAAFALETILRRKGRVLDATAVAIAALRRQLDAPARPLLDELGRLRSELASLLVGGSQGDVEAYQASKATLEEDIDALEAELSRRSSRYRAQSRPVTVAAVQARLPEDAALVEMVIYRPRHPRAGGPEKSEGSEERHGPWGQPRYAAYVLRPHGPPAAIDLGPVRDIDALAQTWRIALQRRQPAAREHARSLDVRIMAPVRALLGSAQHLLLAPDGALNLIPFAALITETGRYLLEPYRITYVTSGRDLLRWDAPPPPRQDTVVMAAPDFDAGTADHWDASAVLASSPGVRFGMKLAPLPGTAAEAEVLARRLTKVELWTGADATETRLARLRGPRLLHLATHGIWLSSASLASVQSAPATREPGRILAPPDPCFLSDPMLCSGLALAGFHGQARGHDDGFLTALEAASLDLFGTQLVVLSACDTGLGRTEGGEGVYGLRRALVVAGAQSQVMSLWKVDDAVTRDLMLTYYDRLLTGAGRSEAMRQTQLALLRQGETAHPYFWASFIVAGDPTPMSGLASRGLMSRGPSTTTFASIMGVLVVGVGVLIAWLRGRRRQRTRARCAAQRRPGSLDE